jgi:hypothetical protein
MVQKFLLLICLFHILTAYNLNSILKWTKLDINKRYYSQDNKNWLSLDSVTTIISSKGFSFVNFHYTYSKAGHERTDYVLPTVNYYST